MHICPDFRAIALTFFFCINEQAVSFSGLGGIVVIHSAADVQFRGSIPCCPSIFEI